MWLYGPAGTGKSSLSGSVAEQLKRNDQLGAFCAFRRGDEGNRNTRNMFQSIARQLAHSHPNRRSALINALRDMTSEKREQIVISHWQVLELLILGPCKSVSPQMIKTTIIIIIEGIDECEPAADRNHLVAAFSTCSLPPDIRILLVSRTSTELSRRLSKCAPFNMENIDVTYTDSDMKSYIEYQAPLLELQFSGDTVVALVNRGRSTVSMDCDGAPNIVRVHK